MSATVHTDILRNQLESRRSIKSTILPPLRGRGWGEDRTFKATLSEVGSGRQVSEAMPEAMPCRTHKHTLKNNEKADWALTIEISGTVRSGGG